jgi:hypothetical protein
VRQQWSLLDLASQAGRNPSDPLSSLGKETLDPHKLRGNEPANVLEVRGEGVVPS